MSVVNTRLCFKSSAQASSSKYTLECLPNFLLNRNGLSNPLPSTHISQNVSHTPSSLVNFTQHKQLVSQTLSESAFHNSMARRCAQFIVCNFDKNTSSKFSCSASTCTFIQTKGQTGVLFGCTVLHVLKSSSPLTNSILFCLVNTSHIDLLANVDRNVKKWFKQGGIKNVQKELKYFLSRNPDIYKIQGNILQDSHTYRFLKLRKKYLDTVVDVRQLFVPGCHLHALPSIDFLPFVLPQKLKAYVRSQQTYFSLDQSKPKGVEGQTLYLPSYQNNSESFSLDPRHTNQEYCQVLRTLFKPQSISKNKDALDQEFSTKMFVNQDLSLSVCLFKSLNLNLIAFEGNTLTGSSGGPLYDSEGRLWGLNFGYITDLTEPDTQHYQNRDCLHEYDININQYEDKEKFRELKNFNVALRIDCQVIQQWIKQTQLQ